MPAWLTRNVLAMGIVSLLTDVGSEMAMSVLPLFLTTTLGAGAVWLGAVEGVAQAVAAVLKLWSGRLVDRTGKAKRLVLLGYGVSSAVRPFLALAGSAVFVLAVRATDRIGKGLRTSPRDALLAVDLPPEARGRAYAFHRAMDHAGAVIGPLIALAAIGAGADLRVVFAATAIPGLLAVIGVAVGVTDYPLPRAPAGVPQVALPKAMRTFIVPLALSSVARVSEAFLLLRVGVAAGHAAAFPLVWTALHVVKVVAAGVGGQLADRLGPRRTVALGWAVQACVYTWLALVEDPVLLLLGVLAHGVFDGLAEAPEKTLVASMVPDTQRGAAFGAYHMVVGFGAIPSGLIVGALWDAIGPQVAFATAGVTAALALLLLGALRPPAGHAPA